MSENSPAPIPACYDAPDQETERLVQMFVDIAQGKRIAQGQNPAQRAVFRKLHGVAHGYIEPHPSAPPNSLVGMFGHARRDVWVRFSSDAAPADPDQGTTVGIGIKLFGVEGENALGESGNTADLIMQNFPYFFVDTAKEMVEFTYAGVVQQNYPAYLAKHKKTNRIINAMEKTESSVLTTTFWGILPFHLGHEVVKYRLTPDTPAENVPNDETNYLEIDCGNRLATRDYGFTLSVQRRTHPDTMPLDAATQEWSEAESPFVPLMRLTLPKQDIWTRGQAEYGQSLSYNIWRVPAKNAPSSASSIAVVRRGVYAAGAKMRHTANGQPLVDPTVPRPVTPAPGPGARSSDDSCVVKAVIYPPIGIARVGRSPDDYFIGPEVNEPPPMVPGFYRDSKERLKRQAARFRVYGVNAMGKIVRELTGVEPGVHIDWTVQLANTKAAWYTFQIALDIPEASSADPTILRNAAIADRAALAITPKAGKVSGANAHVHKFDDGKFMGKPVYLGEAFTDAAQRLVVLGGHGESASFNGLPAITFANNEGWHDDVSDGPVGAQVTYHGVRLDVVPAWVVVAPPNYAPQRKSVRTMWDLMRDTAIKGGMLPAPVRPSFMHDIYPLFERMAGLQWVNAGFAAGFGWAGTFDLTSPAVIARLGSTDPAFKEQRRVIANSFRHFEIDGVSPMPWPWMYGDAMNIPPANTPRQHASLTDTQLALLKAWAEGNFEADYDAHRVPPKALEEVPLAEQGDMLTKAALEFCLADAFHPGCEMTWPVRTPSLYSQPFRFQPVEDGWVMPQLGAILSPDTVTIPNGPLFGQEPGSITRWMAVPWQTDTASCRSGYTPSYDPYVPSFWPARVPNEVLTVANYKIVIDKNKPMEERRRAFANRAAWIAPLGDDGYTHQINNMIAHFDNLGVVEVRDGPQDGSHFPAQMEVEDRHTLVTPNEEKFTAGAHGGKQKEAHADLSEIDKVRRFPRGLIR